MNSKLFKKWGGPPGPLPTPSSASVARVMAEPDQGVRRGRERPPYRELLALSLLLACLATAQEKTAIQTSGEEVLVDVVVRDKKGHAVTSLSQSSFTVLEEGMPRQISSFRDPFVVGDKTVTPALMPTINKSVSTSLPFYIIVYPNTHNAAKPEMFIEFDRDGKVKRVAPAAMDAPDSSGRIQYVANAPIGQFDPGNYAVRFVVRQGAEVAEEDLSIHLEP